MYELCYLEPKIGLGQTCKSTDICANDNATCRNGRCMCRSEFGLDSNRNKCGKLDRNNMNGACVVSWIQYNSELNTHSIDNARHWSTK